MGRGRKEVRPGLSATSASAVTRNQAMLDDRVQERSETGTSRTPNITCPMTQTGSLAVQGPSSLLLSLPLHMTVSWVTHTNGQGASNPGAPCSPFSPLGPFLPFFPFSPCGYKGSNQRVVWFLLGRVREWGESWWFWSWLVQVSLEGHLPLWSWLGKVGDLEMRISNDFSKQILSSGILRCLARSERAKRLTCEKQGLYCLGSPGPCILQGHKTRHILAALSPYFSVAVSLLSSSITELSYLKPEDQDRVFYLCWNVSNLMTSLLVVLIEESQCIKNKLPSPVTFYF